jgi:energy-coupling factor transporter transmembrane protein EcfT
MLPPLGPRVKQQRGRELNIPVTTHIIDRMTRKSNPDIDARVSLAVFTAIGLCALFVLDSSRAMIGLLVYLGAMYAALGAGPASTRHNPGRPVAVARTFARHLYRLGPAVVLIVVLNGALVPGEAVLSVGAKTVMTREGTAAGLFFSLRLLVLYASMLLFFAFTPPVKFAQGIYALVRPFSRRLANHAAFYGFLVLSFLPLFTDELERIRQAQSFRGASLKAGGLAGRAAAARSMVVPLMLSAIHRSGQLAAVVELRGLRDRVGSALPPDRPGKSDAVLAATTTVVLATIALWSERGGG